MHITSDVQDLAKQKEETNGFLEDIFLFTLEPNYDDGSANVRPKVYLEDSRSQLNQNWLDLQTIEQVIFERIMLSDPNENMTIKGGFEAAEKDKIKYLLQCFIRLNKYKKNVSKEFEDKCQNVIIQQSVFVLQQEDVFPEDSNPLNLYKLFFEYREKGSSIFFFENINN